MEPHDLHIEILKNGEVKVHIKGVKGERCLSYVEFLKQAVGPLKERQLTAEYYEREGKVRSDARAEQEVREEEG